jgi:putative flippase GtrA
MQTHHIVDKTLGVYAIVNVFCWCIGTGIMFLLYNLAKWSYWISSACNYIAGGTLGYFLNRKYTFQNHDNKLLVLVKYVLHMFACYAIAYSLAPALLWPLLAHTGLKLTGNLTLALGAVLFTLINYFGQRYLVFRRLLNKSGK